VNAPAPPSGAAPGPGADTLYDGAACGLLLTRPDGLIRRINDTLCGWLGRDRESLVGHVKVQDLFTTGSRIFHQTRWAPLLQIHGSVAEVKLEVTRLDGTSLPVVVNAVRREHAGEVFHELAMFVAEDRHRYEQELLAVRRRAEALAREEQEVRRSLAAAHEERDRERAMAEDRALFAEQMMGIVSHDLRNPLSVIRMSAHILGMGDLTANQMKVLQRLSHSNDRALRLIAELLDFTRARLGRGLPMETKVIEPHRLVADSLQELRLAYPARRIVHVREGAGACQASSDRLVQAIGNLVSNAVQHGSADGTITVTSTVGPAGCTIAVHNEGQPLPAQHLSSIFEPMVRGAERGASEGVGLGLYIVREIAHAHGGQVSVDSTAERGTTFVVRIPSAAR
jgi:phosphoserine phosphatase RsbU/P